MVITIMLLLALTAFGLTVASMIGKVPLWAAVLILTLIALIQAAVPLR